jgi:hypothetical protein
MTGYEHRNLATATELALLRRDLQDRHAALERRLAALERAEQERQLRRSTTEVTVHFALVSVVSMLVFFAALKG